jgi:phosphate transport system protein
VTEHTLRIRGQDLDYLTAEVARIGGLAEAEVSDAIKAIARRDVALAQTVIGRDVQLDRLAADVETAAIRVLSRYEPMADDLRRAVAAMKIAANIARCGDLAKNIAKRAIVIAEAEPITPLTRSIERMGKLVANRLKDVLDAFTAGDVARANSVWSRDEEVDEHYDSLFRELLTYMMGDPRMITACAHLLFVAKNLERIGDHATNIAEIVLYQITGEDVATPRPKLDFFPS